MQYSATGGCCRKLHLFQHLLKLQISKSWLWKAQICTIRYAWEKSGFLLWVVEWYRHEVSSKETISYSRASLSIFERITVYKCTSNLVFSFLISMNHILYLGMVSSLLRKDIFKIVKGVEYIEKMKRKKLP